MLNPAVVQELLDSVGNPVTLLGKPMMVAPDGSFPNIGNITFGPGCWYGDPSQSPFVTLAPREDVQPDCIVEEK